MKKIKRMTLTLSIVFPAIAISQGPTGSPPAINTNARAAAAWYRGGNNLIGNANNIFGTMWNSPIYTYTNGVGRTRLNGTQNANINGFNVVTSGYMGISPVGFFNNNSPFSLLHLSGRSGTTTVQQFGYRPWMKTGITLTDNSDLSYFGLRQVANTTDVTETVMAWSDNALGFGPDDFAFRFTDGNGGTLSNDNNTASDLDGRHIARFTGLGLMGLGNTFGTNAANPGNYVRPQSLLHMSYTRRGGNAYERYGFMQITYRSPLNGGGETQNDGLRLGIDNQIVNGGLNAYLRWQENTPFIVQTDWNNATGGTQNGERMRISSIGAPGVPNPANAPNNNITRVAISHRGNQPITAPRSLLHLGYNTGGAFATNDGWRNWMDVGTFTNIGSDNMYVGMKQEGTDRYDAVINWGDNQVPGSAPNGPDFLRFIFTSTTTALPPGGGDPVSQSNNGLEVARMDPRKATTMPNSNFGMVGIGNFTGNPTDIDAKLDIDGDLRIRTVTQDDNLTQVLVIDSSDKNRVHWRDLTIPQGNGFTECSDTTGVADLTADSKVNLNDNNLFFETNQGVNTVGQNHVGIGYDCGSQLDAKLSVVQVHPQAMDDDTKAISGVNNDVTSAVLKTYSGVYGESTQIKEMPLRPTNVGGDFKAGNATLNYGVRGIVEDNPQQAESNYGVAGFVDDANSAVNVGGFFYARNSESQSLGVVGIASKFYDVASSSTHGQGGVFRSESHNIRNTGVRGTAGNQFWSGTPLGESIGVDGRAYNGVANYGVYGEVQPGANNYAGYFAGPVVMNQTAIWSDENLKENIVDINDSDSLLNLLNPVTFTYKQVGDAERLNLPTGSRYGLIAQQVEQSFPEFVSVARHPAKLDSVGNIVSPAFEYKVLDLEQMIPVLIGTSKKHISQIENLQTEINSKDSIINNLNDRLTQLENCLSGILPFLCQMSHTAIEQNDETIQEQLIRTINVELTDKNNIVLNQNVPNPFAESTVITYSIPESVGKAQIHFYNGTGQLINSVDVDERGAGRMNVFGSDLSSGVYTYSLVADGKVVSTKRMVKQ